MLLAKANPHGGDIYTMPIVCDFSANTSPLGTPETVKEAIRQGAEQLTPYPDPYCRALRQKLSQTLRLPIETILCGNGAAEVIFAFASAARFSSALIVTPTFCEYQQALEAAGTSCRPYALSPESGFTLTEELLSAINDRTGVVVICNPNNPTGKLYPASLMRRIARRCKETGTFLLVDECFFDLTGADASCSLLDEVPQNPYLFILKAFTKSYGMAGVRLGYGVCSNEDLLEKMTQQTQVWNVSTLAQLAGIAAIDCRSHIAENLKIIAEERPKLANALKAKGYRVYDSDANFLLFQAKKGLYEEMLQQGIQIRRCGNFHGLDDSFYRIAVKNSVDNRLFLKALAEVIREDTDAVF